MSVTYTSENKSNLGLNKFASQSDYEAAVEASQVATNDISFIEEVDSEIQAGPSKFGVIKTSDNYNSAYYSGTVAINPSTGSLYTKGEGIGIAPSPMRIWTMPDGVYKVLPSTVIYYYGATSTNSITATYGGLIFISTYSSNKNWVMLTDNNTSNGEIRFGYTSSSSGSSAAYNPSNFKTMSNGGAYAFGVYNNSSGSLNTSTVAQNGVYVGYATSSTAGRPMITYSGNTYYNLITRNSYSINSYSSQNANYIRQDIVFPTLNRHFYRIVKWYSSAITPNTSIAGADSNGWVELDIPPYPSYAGNAGKVLKVNSSATDVEWGDAAAAVADLTDASVSSPANGNVLQYVSTTGKWTNLPAPTGTVPSPTASGQYLYSPDGTNVSWSTLGATVNANYNYSSVTCDSLGVITIDVLDDSQNYFVCTIPSNYDGESIPILWASISLPSTNTCIHYLLIVNNSNYDLNIDLSDQFWYNYGPTALPVIPSGQAVEISFLRLSDITANIWTNTMTLDIIPPQ